MTQKRCSFCNEYFLPRRSSSKNCSVKCARENYPRRNIYLRFIDNIEKKNGCWNWTGNKGRSGYGSIAIKIGGKMKAANVSAHRFSYVIFKGRIPDKFHIDHLCRNILCVNPDHLEAVTLHENLRRGVGVCALNSRKTHCKNGHEFTAENVYKIKSGRKGRGCRKCIYKAGRNYYLRKTNRISSAPS